MTNNNHPITPPLELVKQWLAEFYGPESMPGMAPREMVLHVAAVAALHAAAYQLLAVQWNAQIPVSATEQIGINWARDALHVLANELEAL